MIEVRELHGGDHEVIPDRIEAGTYLAAAAMTYGMSSRRIAVRVILRRC